MMSFDTYMLTTIVKTLIGFHLLILMTSKQVRLDAEVDRMKAAAQAGDAALKHYNTNKPSA